MLTGGVKCCGEENGGRVGGGGDGGVRKSMCVGVGEVREKGFGGGREGVSEAIEKKRWSWWEKKRWRWWETYVEALVK